MITPEETSPRSQEPLSNAIKLSVLMHLLLLLVLYVKSVVMPPDLHTKEYLPSLRVDLVALPEHKINEQVTPALPPSSVETKKPAEPAKPEPREKVEKKADLKEKTEAAEQGDYSLKKKTKESKKEKMKGALERIKALEKIREGETLKGNVVRKGSSAKGDASRSAETTYFDVVLEKVRNEWELPSWLQGKGLSAKVLIKIDRRGMITVINFVRSSGNSQFDAAVKRALYASMPFPVPPVSVLADVMKDGVILGFPIAD